MGIVSVPELSSSDSEGVGLDRVMVIRRDFVRVGGFLDIDRLEENSVKVKVPDMEPDWVGDSDCVRVIFVTQYGAGTTVTTEPGADTCEVFLTSGPFHRTHVRLISGVTPTVEAGRNLWYPRNEALVTTAVNGTTLPATQRTEPMFPAVVPSMEVVMVPPRSGRCKA